MPRMQRSRLCCGLHSAARGWSASFCKPAHGTRCATRWPGEMNHSTSWKGVRMVRGILVGTLAGAAGTVALNIVTYADIALRGRPASEAPAKVAEMVAA